MVDVARATPHALRFAVVAACIIGIFLFFDPVGFASSSMAHRVPGGTNSVTHIVLYQFKKTADPAAIDVVCPLVHMAEQSLLRHPRAGADWSQACARMLALKDNCVLPNTQNAYIGRISGGRDNSNERLQVRPRNPY